MSNSITDVRGIKVGSVEDMQAMTGCTVILTGKRGAVCGVDVRGAAPGTRETDLLSPICTVKEVHAVLLTGGSAFGLDAAGGVMDYLEEEQIGINTGTAIVPIVPAAVLYDLAVGNPMKRPDRQMGYLACKQAGHIVREGNVGAGAGATVGKIKGYEFCTKSGLGSWAVRLDNGLTVGAIVAVNAFGDVFDPGTGQVLAGVRERDGSFTSTKTIWQERKHEISVPFLTNTTIAVVACNAILDCPQATKVAQMAHNGLAKVINPVHTTFDGDTVFTLATGEVEADLNMVGYLAQEVLSQAILRAVYAAETVYNYRCCRD